MTRYGGNFGGSSAPLTAPTVGGVSGGNPMASQVAAQLLQESQGLAQAGQAASVMQNPSMISDPSTLLAMAMQSHAAKSMAGAPEMSPNGLFSMSGVDHRAPEDAAVIKLAEHYLGTPYVWGGNKPGGFDCSGLLQFVWAKNGVHIPRTSQEQFHYGRPVNMKNLQPGDAVFFEPGPGGPGHVAMYIGNGKV